MKHVRYGAFMGVLLASIGLMPVASSATTIAQNSSWRVTRTGATQTFRVVAYGDSIFAGYTSATNIARRAAPLVLGEYCAARTGQNWQVFRRCQSGAVASDIYNNRINTSTDRAFMQDASTRVVTFEMCGNDYLQARSSFKSATGTCNYSGLNTALANCKNYTQLAMQNINLNANANTQLKIVSNLYYPGYNADDSYSTCTDAVNGNPANGNKVHMRTFFLPLLAESNWWVCNYADQNGFVCADSFATYMARDYDSNNDGKIDSDQIRYIKGESLADYKTRIVAAYNAGLLRDANLKLVNNATTFDYIQSDDTHPTFEGPTASSLFGPTSGDIAVLNATAGAYPDGKNPHWNQNGHDRMGWKLDPACALPVPKCGNGAVETAYVPSGAQAPEACDDGNTNNGDGCSSTCAIETGYLCSGAPSMCAPVCGDGIIAGNEVCDDGDATSGDGCSSSCSLEPGFACTGVPSVCSFICGDGMVVFGEECDDGNPTAGDGCSDSCVVETGWSCSGDVTTTCAPICGDGLILGTEQCDDGNVEENDGCAAGCTIETGWTCDGEPSGCSPICGDGLVKGGEECDAAAANGTSASCCTGSCGFQAPGTNCDDGNACTVNDACTMDGTCFSDTPRDCDDANVCTDDSCEPSTGCAYENNADPCDDGAFCTGADTCGDGACSVHAGDPCAGGSECNASCNEAADNCFDSAGTACSDDGNVCTNNQCDGAGTCAHPNNTSPCDDGNACTASDTCSAGMCVPGVPVYSFGGFLSPIDGLPIVNVGKAGRTFPIKWQLPLCSGGYVSRLNVVVNNPMRARQVSCDTNAPTDTIETDLPGGSGLTYDFTSNEYHYNWQTSSTFAGKCYELLLDLDNGTQQVARFKFNK